jgi:hypothetical protein
MVARMENEPPADIPPELQVWVDTEIRIEGRNSPIEHQTIESALKDLPGIASINFLEDGVAIRHDPERTTAARIRAIIGEAGFRISQSKTASYDPVDDVHTERGYESIGDDKSTERETPTD